VRSSFLQLKLKPKLNRKLTLRMTDALRPRRRQQPTMTLDQQ
jgi:hypothetical protein